MSKKANIYYFSLTDQMKKQEKLDWFSQTPFSKIPFEKIEPDKNGNWINLTDNDFETLMPVCSKDVKNGKGGNAIFDLFSNGAITARDSWVYDFNINHLEEKIIFLIKYYQKEQDRWKNANFKGLPRDFVNREIKWSDELIEHLVKGTKISFDNQKIRTSLFRPYVKSFEYVSRIIIHRFGQMDKIFPSKDTNNTCIAFSFNSTDFAALSTNCFFDFALLKFANGNTQCLPLYRYEKGEKKENITDWALEEFTNYYDLRLTEKTENQQAKIQKQDIFHYVYAVLHCPEYRQKYEQNLKRDFPRIPLYEDFWKWANLGKNLMDLHLEYENIEKYPLVVCEDTNNGKRTVSSETLPKPKLKANKELGEIYIDENTTLKGVPPIAWDYKLGNRSALEWILDQYKESKPSDATIAEKFNTYRFADYKEQVIDLLQRVCTVSVRTMEVVAKM